MNSLMNENRYSALRRINPDLADELLAANIKEAKRRYAMYAICSNGFQ